MNIKDYSTKELCEELQKREGVEVDIIDPYIDRQFTVNGPALVFVVVD